MQQPKQLGLRKSRLSHSLALLAGSFLLFCMAQLVTAARAPSHHLYRRAASGSGDSGDSGGGGGLPAGAIASIVVGGVAVAGVVGLFTYRHVRNRNRPTHGGKVAKVVGMRGAGALNLQGKMAVLPDDDDFHIGTQQGVVGYDSNLEKPPRAARPMSWYKAREAGVSPLHIQAMNRASEGGIYQEGALEDSDTVELYSPGNIPQVQVAAETNIQTPQMTVVVDSGPARPQPLAAPGHLGGQHLHHPHTQLETPIEGPMGGGDRLAVRSAESAGDHISEVEWESEDEVETAQKIGNVPLKRTPSAKFISDATTTDMSDPNLPSHPRLFMLTPGRDGIQALGQPENWSRSTFQLRLLCEGTANDYSEAHLTEEHGIAIRDPNAFLIHAARYTAQTADALIARADNVFEQAEMFSSSSEASEYFELLSDTLRAWYSDLLVTMEEAAAEGHEVDQDMLAALRAQKEDASAAAKQELGRFLAKYDPKSWFGGLRRTRIQTSGSSAAEVPPERRVRWLCASCASKASQG